MPLVGNLFNVDVRNLSKSLTKLAKKYGDVFSLFVGRTPVVVLNDYDTIKKCFDKTEFSGRPGNFSGTFFQKGKTGISTTEGKYWTSQREFLMSHLAHLTGNEHKSFPTDPFIIQNLSGPGVKSLEDVVMDEVEDLKTWLRKKEGEPLALSYKLNIGILNVLWSVTCGRWEMSALCIIYFFYVQKTSCSAAGVPGSL